MRTHTAADGRILVDVTTLVQAVLAAAAVGALVLGYGVVAAINDWQTPVHTLVDTVDHDDSDDSDGPRWHDDKDTTTV